MHSSRLSKILIVSTNDKIRDSLSSILRAPHCEVSICDSVRSAFFTILSQPVDVVIAEDTLKDDETLDFISRLRLGGNKVPFIILSAGDRDYRVEEMQRQQVEVRNLNALSHPEELIELTKRLINESPKVSQQRKFPRHTCNLDVFYETVRSGEVSLSKGVSLGQGGMFLATSFSLPHIGDFVSFRIAPSGVSPVEVEGIGVVRWVRQRATPQDPSGFAIEFIGLTADTKERVENMISQLTDGLERSLNTAPQ